MTVTSRDPIDQRVPRAGGGDEAFGWLVRQRAWELRLARLERVAPAGPSPRVTARAAPAGLCRPAQAGPFCPGQALDDELVRIVDPGAPSGGTDGCRRLHRGPVPPGP